MRVGHQAKQVVERMRSGCVCKATACRLSVLQVVDRGEVAGKAVATSPRLSFRSPL